LSAQHEHFVKDGQSGKRTLLPRLEVPALLISIIETYRESISVAWTLAASGSI
jgi:hypothetical protein